MNKIVAGIVLYNPNIARYQNCVYKLLEQVEKIYIFDNSDKPINYIESEKIVESHMRLIELWNMQKTMDIIG